MERNVFLKKLFKNGVFQLSWLGTLTAAVLLAGFYTLLCLWIQPNSLRAVLQVFRAQPLLIVLNSLPIGLLILTFTFAFRNVFAAACLTGTLCSILSLANRVKLEVRDEPVFPRDLALLKEVFAATGEYDIHWPWGAIAAIAVCAAATALCALLVRCKPFPVQRLRHGWARLAGAAGSLGILLALILTVYSSNTLYNSFRVTNAYYIPSVFNELGFPYCFTHHFTTYTVDKPEGYSRAEAEGWETGDSTGQGKNVHVIMVMNEAFSDLTDDDAFTYSPEEDPLTNLHAVRQSAHVLSGHIVVPGFAGGTANTEFDVLTGMQTNTLSATTTSAFRAVNRNLDSVLRVFRNDGYETSFLHPGYDWFYNRANVYRWLGAEATRFIDDMPDAEYKGSWVKDSYVARQIQQEFTSAVADGRFLCNYTTTIQNHMSYTREKYGADTPIPPVQTSVALSEEAETLLSVYIEGVRDADAMLGQLTDYFSATDEPVVLAFFGDHLPYLGDNTLAYRELGSQVAVLESERKDLFCSYETPYVLWANDAAAQVLDWDSAVAALDLPEDGNISACYLGATILELTGRGEESPWFQYLTEVRRQLPILQKKSCETADGVIRPQSSLSQEQQALISKLRRWSYYKLKTKEVG